MKVSPILQELHQLKAKKVFSIMTGDYKTAIESSKKYAQLAVDNFELATQPYSPVQASIPLFSKIGWNCFKFMILDKFRKYSPEEKKLTKLVKQWKSEQK